MAMHHGVTPSAIIESMRAVMSSQVSGTSYPPASKTSMLYQTRLFTSPLLGTPQTVPSEPLPSFHHAASYWSWRLSRVAWGTGMAEPSSQKVRVRPGCGMITTSGGSPASSAMLSSVVASRVEFRLTSSPVRSRNGCRPARNDSASVAVSGVRMLTV